MFREMFRSLYSFSKKYWEKKQPCTINVENFNISSMLFMIYQVEFSSKALVIITVTNVQFQISKYSRRYMHKRGPNRRLQINSS